MKTIAFFDLDNTLLNGQTHALLVSYLRRRGLVNSYYTLKIKIWFILYKLDIIKDPKTGMNFGYSFAMGKSTSELATILKDFYNEVLRTKFYNGALKELRRLKSSGAVVVLLSNVARVLLEIIQNDLKLDDSIGTQLESINGVYTGVIEGDLVYGLNKTSNMKRYVERLDDPDVVTVAYADHSSDLDLLCTVDEGIAVNATGTFKKRALISNLKLINFI